MNALLVLVGLALVAGASAVPGGRNTRVIDGKATPIEEAPWAAQVEYMLPVPGSDGFEFTPAGTCTAVLISDTQALTAGHCIDIPGYDDVNELIAKANNFFRLRVGSWLKNTGGHVAAVKSVVVHPKYLGTPKQNGYDIAVIDLAEPLALGDAVQPIKLSTKQVQPGDILSCGGWGVTNRKDEAPSFHEGLKTATVHVLPERKCESLKYVFFKDDEAPVNCVEPETGVNASGDSGGPVWNADKELVGVHSSSMELNNHFAGHTSYSIDVTSDPIRCFLAQHLRGDLVAVDQKVCAELD